MPRSKKIPRIYNHPNLGDWAGEALPDDNMIVIDRNLPPSERLETLVHEAIHLADWKMTEKKVKRMASFIGAVLWKNGYRKVR